MFIKLKIGQVIKLNCKDKRILLVFKNVVEDIRCPIAIKNNKRFNPMCYWKGRALLRFDLYLDNDFGRLQFYKTIKLCVCSKQGLEHYRNKLGHECCAASVSGEYTRTYMDGRYWFVIDAVNLTPERVVDGYDIKKINKKDYEVTLQVYCYNNIVSHNA